MNVNKPNKIICHHAVSQKYHTAEDVGEWHLDRWDGYSPSTIRDDVVKYAGYHYIIEWDGAIVQARAHTDEGIHCKGQNFSSIGICFMGNNDVHYPSEEQKEAWRTLYAKLSAEYGQLPVYPHRKYANKSCHGKLLSDDYYTNLLGIDVKPSIKELQQKLIQLMSQLIVLLNKERMRG